MTYKQLKAAGVVVGLAALLGGAVGCGNRNRVTVGEIRNRPNPELASMALTRDEIKNRHSRTIHTDLRQIQDDLDWILLMDRPSRMTKSPVP